MSFSKCLVFVFVLIVISSPYTFAQNEYLIWEKELVTAINSKPSAEFEGYLQKHSAYTDSTFWGFLLDDAVQKQDRNLFRVHWSIARLHDNILFTSSSAYFFARYLLAQREFETALNFFVKAAADFNGFGGSYGLALCYDGIGDIKVEQHDYRLARDMYLAGLKQLQAAPSKPEQADMYLGLSVSAFNMEYREESFSYARMADSVAVSANDSLTHARAIYTIGRCELLAGDIEQAGNHYMESLQYFKSVQDTAGITQSLWAMGEAFVVMGSDEKGEECFTEILQYKTATLQLQGQAHKDIAAIAMKNGRYETAADHLYDALDCFTLWKDDINIGNTFRQLGNLASYQNNETDAETNFRAAGAKFEEAGSQAGTGNSNLSLAELAYRKNDLPKAEKLARAALDNFEKSCITESIAFGKYWLAKILAKSRPDSALTMYKEALSMLDAIRRRGGNEENKIAYAGKLSDLYAGAIAFLLKQGLQEEAFRFLESMKARAFLEKLGELKLTKNMKGLPPDLRIKVIGNEEESLRLQAELAKAATTAAIDSLRHCLDINAQAKRDLIGLIKKTAPAYAAVFYPQPAGIKNLQKILRKDETLIEYFLSDSICCAFAIHPKGFKVVTFDKSLSEISFLINKYYKLIKNKNVRVQDAELYHVLFEPLKTAPGQKLVIVPDQELYSIPFEALWTGREFLLEKYSISYIQSATLLSVNRSERDKNRGEGFVGFGDPVYDYDGFKAGGEERGGKLPSGKGVYAQMRGAKMIDLLDGLQRLEGSGSEVSNIGKLFQKSGSAVATYLRDNASEEMLKSDSLKKFAYIEIACHGILSDDYQSLALSQLPESNEDGMLTMDEIMNLQWNAKMVVLSACQSGKGKIKKGEGVVGLSRAVMYAGCDAVVASLWNVSDDGTRELMTGFFQNIVVQSLPLKESLNKAKREMLKAEKMSHPYYWAPFVLFGE